MDFFCIKLYKKNMIYFRFIEKINSVLNNFQKNEGSCFH